MFIITHTRIACHLYSKKGPTWSAHKLVQNKEHPAFMQDGLDREDNPNQYIQNMKDGAVAGFRYFDFESYEPDSISVKIRGKANGYFYIYDDADKKNILGKIAIVVNDKKNFCCIKDSLTVPKKNSALYFEYKGNSTIELTAREFEILKYLAENKGRVISRERLYEAIWGEDSFGCDNTIMVHIRHLREKLEDNPTTPQYIITMKGLGYKLVNPYEK